MMLQMRLASQITLAPVRASVAVRSRACKGAEATTASVERILQVMAMERGPLAVEGV